MKANRPSTALISIANVLINFDELIINGNIFTKQAFEERMTYDKGV
jgi:hypothetical protein